MTDDARVDSPFACEAAAPTSEPAVPESPTKDETMEIHVPSKPILSVREALVHLAIVTVGILIALSFEGVREYVEHRELANHARENLFDEIRANKAALDGMLTTIGRSQDNYRRAHRAIKNLLADQPSGVDNLNFSPDLAGLSTAAYSTAQVTQAFSYMEYEEVRGFTSLYDMQAQYMTLQDRALAGLTGFSGPMMLNGLDHASKPDLQEMQRRLEEVFATSLGQQQFGMALSGLYDARLKARASGNAR